jgi:hypothetical protein
MLIFDYEKYHIKISGGFAFASGFYMFTANEKNRKYIDISYVLLVSFFLFILYIFFDHNIFKDLPNFRLLIYIRLLIFVFNYVSQKFYQRNVSISRGDNVKTDGRRFFDFSYLIACIVMMVLVTKQII